MGESLQVLCYTTIIDISGTTSYLESDINNSSKKIFHIQRTFKRFTGDSTDLDDKTQTVIKILQELVLIKYIKKDGVREGDKEEVHNVNTYTTWNLLTGCQEHTRPKKKRKVKSNPSSITGQKFK